MKFGALNETGTNLVQKLKRMSTPIGETEKSTREKLEYLARENVSLQTLGLNEKSCAESCRYSLNFTGNDMTVGDFLPVTKSYFSKFLKLQRLVWLQTASF